MFSIMRYEKKWAKWMKCKEYILAINQNGVSEFVGC